MLSLMVIILPLQPPTFHPPTPSYPSTLLPPPILPPFYPPPTLLPSYSPPHFPILPPPYQSPNHVFSSGFTSLLLSFVVYGPMLSISVSQYPCPSLPRTWIHIVLHRLFSFCLPLPYFPGQSFGGFVWHFWLDFETGSPQSVAQVCQELPAILLSLMPKCLDYKYKPKFSGSSFFKFKRDCVGMCGLLCSLSLWGLTIKLCQASAVTLD